MSNSPTKLKIGIVGGSIAGCIAALELLRDGHDVRIYERGTAAPLGAGIGLFPHTLAALVDRGFVPALLPHIEVREHLFVGRAPNDAPMGRCAWRGQFTSVLLNWTHLHKALRAHVPNDAYRSGCEAIAFEQAAACAQLTFSAGDIEQFDLVVFADGYRSRGRSWICPESQPQYRSYVLWRGLVPEAQLPAPSPLEPCTYRIAHVSGRGHTALYAIPATDDSAEPTQRLVNFACSLPLPAAEVPAFLTDRHGQLHGGAIAPGLMRPSEEARLRSQLSTELPPYFAQLLSLARDTFAQLIYSVAPARHRLGRAVLLGDAGALAQPHTGSGILKSVQGALTLAAQLRAETDLDAALTSWNVATTAFGAKLVQLGEHMERPLIWEVPNLGTLDSAATQAWWTAATRLPDA